MASDTSSTSILGREFVDLVSSMHVKVREIEREFLRENARETRVAAYREEIERLDAFVSWFKHHQSLVPLPAAAEKATAALRSSGALLESITPQSPLTAAYQVLESFAREIELACAKFSETLLALVHSCEGAVHETDLARGTQQDASEASGAGTLRQPDSLVPDDAIPAPRDFERPGTQRWVAVTLQDRRPPDYLPAEDAGKAP